MAPGRCLAGSWAARHDHRRGADHRSCSDAGVGASGSAGDADFDRLAEIYAEDAQWLSGNRDGPHCRNRDDIFAMFGQRLSSGIRVGFDELRSTPNEVLLAARVADFGAVVSVFSFQGRRIVAVKDYPSMAAGGRPTCTSTER